MLQHLEPHLNLSAESSRLSILGHLACRIVSTVQAMAAPPSESPRLSISPSKACCHVLDLPVHGGPHAPARLPRPAVEMTHMASVCSVYHQLVPSTKPVDRPHPPSSPSPNTSPGLANGPTPHRGKPPPSTPMSLLLQTFNLPSTGVEMMARPRADDGRLETRRSLQSANPRPQATPHTYLPATMLPPQAHRIPWRPSTSHPVKTVSLFRHPTADMRAGMP